MNKNIKNAIYILLLTIIPITLILPFAISYDRMDFVEIGLVVIGCIELMMLNVRVGRRERANRKKYNRYKSSPTDEGYDEFKNVQMILVISGIVNILTSVLWFYIFL